MLTQSTQDLLNEVKAPTSATTDDVQQAVLGFLASLAAVKDQVGKYQRVAQQVQIAEVDADLRARMMLYFQTIGAMQDHLSELDRWTQEIVSDFRQLDRYDGEIRPAAAEKGYTV